MRATDVSCVSSGRRVLNAWRWLFAIIFNIHPITRILYHDIAIEMMMIFKTDQT